MRICVVQMKPLKGDIEGNIARHKQFIEMAVADKTDMVIFPELSITRYEPALARELAIDKDDNRLDVFQNIADERRITIGIGAPTRQPDGNCISMVIFRPLSERATYSKEYIHADEEPFFVSGRNSMEFIAETPKIAPAICYEISISEHSKAAFDRGAKVYVASAAKTAEGVENAIKTLSAIAKKYSMTVLMSNCIGPCDNFHAGGRSSAWNENGVLMGQMDKNTEGYLILDTETQAVLVRQL